jgi:hypothetical protein
MNISEKIESYCKYIKLPEVRKNFKAVAEEAEKENLSYEKYLYLLLPK